MEVLAAKRRCQEGSAVVESLFGIFFLLFLTVGTIQVALSLYARNVVMTAVHDGARAAIEVGTSHSQAAAAAQSTIRRSAGSLVDDLEVATSTRTVSGRLHTYVTAIGELDAPGPIPIQIPVRFEAMSTREVLDAARS